MVIPARTHKFRDASAVLVVWSEVASDALTHMRATITRITQSTQAGSDEASISILDEIVQSEGTTRMRFCDNELASVEEVIEQAVSQGGKQILVVPVVVAMDVPPDMAFMQQMALRISQVNARYPDADILYLGPPFDRVQRIGSVITKTLEEQSADLLKGAIERGFKKDWALFAQFMQKLQAAVAIDTRVALRGSAVTGVNYNTGRPFDAAGPGTSDLDVVLMGEPAIAEWKPEAFYFPNVNTLPLGDDMPDIAPRLNPVRVELQQMVGRPVNIQAMQKWFLDLRSELQGTPYVFLDA
jgi:hypothetical protein